MKYIAVMLLVIWSSVSYSSSPFKLFVSPSGNDKNDGLSNSVPIITLSRAQDILESYDPNQAIEIHIDQGTYYGQSVIWTYTNGHSITFTPIDFTSERPIFDGGGTLETWFTLNKTNGTASNLRFRYIKVQNYNTAMSFNGNRNQVSHWNSGNELYGMFFSRIGGRYSTSSYSTAAIRFVNSRDNSISNNHFVDILNNSAEASAIHAIYFAHYSSNNIVFKNRFLRVNGDPIKIRDESNFNSISDNRFYSSGNIAFYQGWYCNKKIRDDCTKASGECPSIGNEFRKNDLYGGYTGAIKSFNIREDDDYCGLPSTPRLKVSGNAKYY